MKNIADNLAQLIGKTPLLYLRSFSNYYQLESNIIAKLECFNPGGSIKDRVGFSIIREAENEGKIKKDTILIEATSGNTGIALAYIAASKGLRLILTMPETMSIERRKILSMFGAELVLTPGAEGMNGAVKKARELNNQIKGSFMTRQFENPANPKIHRETTAMEIWNDTDGKIDILVSGVGTGGTITGTGEILKQKNPDIQIVAVEPSASPVLSGGQASTHRIQGIGAGFIPPILNKKIIDEIIQVENDDAFETMSLLAKTEGLLVGISSGAAVFAAKILAKRNENFKKNIVAILPDTGERYLSICNPDD